MNILDYFIVLLQFLFLVPPAILCYLPMRNSIKLKVNKMILFSSALFLPYFLIISFIVSIFHLDSDICSKMSFIVFFVFYCFTVKSSFAKKIAIFSAVNAVFMNITGFSYITDAIITNFSGEMAQISVGAKLVRMGLELILFAVLWIPFKKYAFELVNKVNVNRIWLATLPITLSYVTVTLMFYPRQYHTLTVNNVLTVSIIQFTFSLALLLFIYYLFYRISHELIEKAELQRKSQFFEMQKKQFYATQNYLNETGRLRHDFKHSIRTISSLFQAGKIDELKDYVHLYENNMPKSEVIQFCGNNVVNAVLNYYYQTAQQEKIQTTIKVGIPDTIPFDEVDFCSLLGNLLDNSIAACKTVENETPYLKLTIRLVNNGCVFIASTNNFGENLKIKNGEFYSTKHKSKGIGLNSIKLTADKLSMVADNVSICLSLISNCF